MSKLSPGKEVNCMHQTGRAQSIQPSDVHTVGVHHVCHDIEHHFSYWSPFRLTWKVSDNEIFFCSLNKCQRLSNM